MAENKKKFNLSEKIIGNPHMMNVDVFKLEDVKEFIRLLKERFGEWIFETEDLASAFEIIDKLAGDKLIWQIK